MNTNETLPKIAEDITALIGGTPMLRVRNLDTGPCTLLLKLECQNPGNSIKDRIAVSMINRAEEEGRLQPGGTIYEGTAGNTGIALALVGVSRGYKVKVVMPDKMSRGKISHLKAAGAEVVPSPVPTWAAGTRSTTKTWLVLLPKKTPTDSSSISLRMLRIPRPTSKQPAQKSGPRLKATSIALWPGSARAARSVAVELPSGKEPGC